MSGSIGHALLLLVDIEHYADYQDDDLALKLKWHTIAVGSSSPESI